LNGAQIEGDHATMTSVALTLAGTAALVLAGMFAWTLGEYVIHRWMHEMLGKGMPSREHLVHHAVGGDNEGRPVLSWLGIAVVGAVLFVAGAGQLGAWLFDARWAGVALYAGWLVGYGVYERIHNRSHSHAPTGRYTAWVRRHHFHHHHGHPMANHGVTVPLWDRVFGTLEQAEVIRVPRRHAMRWLVDEAGEVKAEYQAHYVLVGGADNGERQQMIDKARAFANLAPVPG
jgi:sterol desaturase/sphingolipid hydroxylase (fatty acid hydroxylase superfamily)